MDFRGWVLGLLMVGCVGAPDVSKHEAGLRMCPDGPTVEGIDVSHWQSTIDWDRVAAADDVEYAFVRVSHGTSTLDTQFARNWPEVRRVGIMRGVYHFFSAGDDPIEQANLLIDAIGGSYEPGDLPPVLDVENESQEGLPAATVIANMRIWLDHVEAELGVRPIIYSAKYFWQDNLGNPDFSDYPLWVAHYGVDCPNAPDAFDRWMFWQYTSTGSVDGISTGIDRNVFNGTTSDLLAFVGAEPRCGDGWCTGGETATSCAGDCPFCPTVPSLGREVDESELCFERGGNPMYLRDVTAGYLDSLIWTHTTDGATASNFGIWELSFDEAGRYRVEAYTAAAYAESAQARYEVRHGGSNESFIVDQTGVDGWSPIAELSFAMGGDQYVRLDDNTGEPGATNTQLVFDALRITRLDPPVVVPDAGILGTDGGVVVLPDGGMPVADGGAPMRPMASGCGCTIAARTLPPMHGAALVGIFALVRFRRRAVRARSPRYTSF